MNTVEQWWMLERRRWRVRSGAPTAVGKRGVDNKKAPICPFCLRNFRCACGDVAARTRRAVPPRSAGAGAPAYAGHAPVEAGYSPCLPDAFWSSSSPLGHACLLNRCVDLDLRHWLAVSLPPPLESSCPEWREGLNVPDIQCTYAEVLKAPFESQVTSSTPESSPPHHYCARRG